MATDSTYLGSRVTTDFADRVRQAAEAEDRSVGYLIRRALARDLQRMGVEPEHERPEAA